MSVLKFLFKKAPDVNIFIEKLDDDRYLIRAKEGNGVRESIVSAFTEREMSKLKEAGSQAKKGWKDPSKMETAGNAR